jgi:hypothetical protein
MAYPDDREDTSTTHTAYISVNTSSTFGFSSIPRNNFLANNIEANNTAILK